MSLNYASSLHAMGTFPTIPDTPDNAEFHGIECRLKKIATGKYDITFDKPFGLDVFSEAGVISGVMQITMLGDRGGQDVANWGTYSVREISPSVKRVFFADGSNGEPEDTPFMMTAFRYPGPY